jgi:hypothetical protein
MSRIASRAGLGACCVTLSTLLCPSHLSAEEQADLLAVVRAAHRAARESIHTLSATVTIERTFPKNEVLIAGQYWRSLGLVRVREVAPTGTNDYLLKDSEIRQVSCGVRPGGGANLYTASRKPPTEMLCMCDVWPQMLIEFGGPAGGQYDFDRFLEFAKEGPKLKYETLDGRQCIRLTMSLALSTGGESAITLWHDVAYNYLVRKLVAKYRKTGGWGEVEILDFLESPPGVFLPTKCRRRTYGHGKQVTGSITTLSDVRINEPIPPSIFQLPSIPRGTILWDWVQGRKYPVDQNWRLIGRAEPLGKFLNIDASAAEDSGERSPSTEEPRSVNRWLVLASLIILATAGVLGLYRRFWRARPLSP